jgi:ankyrin repeat protein
LHSASANGKSDVIRALLHAGAMVDISAPLGEWKDQTAYNCASPVGKEAYHVFFFEQIANGDVSAVLNLLRGGVSANLRDDSATDDSALHWSCCFGKQTLACLLLEHGADANYANKRGQTALHVACENGDLELVRVLLRAGAAKWILDDAGRTPLQLVKDSEPVTKSNELRGLIQDFECQEDQALSASPSPPQTSPAQAMKPSSTALTSSTSPSSSQVVRKGQDEALLETDDKDNINVDSNRDLLVLWPPVQSQELQYGKHLRLSTTAPLVLSINGEIDLFPLLTWSGLVEILDRHGISMQVKRPFSGAQMRLSVDQTICPGRHRYELRIQPECALLNASDTMGLLYGVYALVQLIQLHSDVVHHKDRTDLYLPCISISDYPDLPDRAVLWSYRQCARSSYKGMRDAVQLLSKLHINRLFLSVESDAINVGAAFPGAETSDDETREDSSLDHEGNSLATKICAIDETCRRHGVELVPTLVISCVKQCVQMDSVIKNFSHSTVCLLFLLEPAAVDIELKANCFDHNEFVPGVTIPGRFLTADGQLSSEEAARFTCVHAMACAQLAGCQSILIGANDWTTTYGQPLLQAAAAGLNATQRDLATLFPASRAVKPVVCPEALLSSLSDLSSRACALGHPTVLMPAMLDGNFAYPLLLTKYACFLHAGFAWNTRGVMDMLGDSWDMTLLHECYSLLCGFRVSVGPSNTSGHFIKAMNTLSTAQVQEETVLGLLLGVRSSTEELDQGCSLGVRGPAVTELAEAEAHLWSLLINERQRVEHAPAPGREVIAELLKQYRRVGAAARWKVSDYKKVHTNAIPSWNLAALEEEVVPLSEFDLEIQEMLAVIHMLAVIARAFVLAYNTLGSESSASSPRSYTVGELLSLLSTGTKSDTANALLEALECCFGAWKQRFDSLQLRPDPKSGSVNDREKGYSQSHTLSTATRRCIMRGKAPPMPGAGLLRIVCDFLAIDVEECLRRIQES